MQTIKTLCALALGGLLLTGCLDGGGGGSDDDVGGQPGPGPGEPGGSVSFTNLVRDIFDDTSDTAEPRAINGLEITYDDQDNEGAFDDLLSQQ
ncbi:hypothetical protein LCGC14_0300600 [marine sediment metagenome]|uniref:Uncharacterized protein n=1 Tax=marine sediment metagenome TaxID=412755 RepID=A0A0F9WBY9_9ZZZZ